MIDTSVMRTKAVEAAIKGELTRDYTSAKSAKDELSDLMRRSISAAPLQPFEVKDSWVWVELTEIAANVPYPFADGPFGSNLKREHYTTDKQVRIIQLSNIGELGWKDDNEKYTTYEHLETIKRSEVEAGNIVIAKMMPAGRAVIVPAGSSKYVLSSDCVKFVPFEKLNERYICYAINSPMFREQVLGEVHGIGRERTSLSKLKKYVIPLPVIEEQNLIVERLDRVFELLERIDLLQERYSSNYKVLKDKIIDAGIRGELTEQLPGDGTAEELYLQIQAQKTVLVKEKKIKKSKPLQSISKEEIPFDIPDNWKWTRIGDIFTLQSGKNIKASSIREKTDREHLYACYGGNGRRGYVDHYNVSGKHALIGRQGALCGNINVADGNFYATEHAVVVYQYAGTSVSWASIVLKALNLNQYATSVAQPGLAVGKINEVLIPLPPLAEQRRIAAKIDDLLAAMSVTLA